MYLMFQVPHGPMGAVPGQHPHNTLPARVGDNHQAARNFPHNIQPSGRHFKPFDHRKINPMAEIQENPYEHNNGQFPSNGHDNTYIVHHNTHIPHMPSELRHTNYGNGQHPHLVHPQVMQHRDSSLN